MDQIVHTVSQQQWFSIVQACNASGQPKTTMVREKRRRYLQTLFLTHTALLCDLDIVLLFALF